VWWVVGGGGKDITPVEGLERVEQCLGYALQKRSVSVRVRSAFVTSCCVCRVSCVVCRVPCVVSLVVSCVVGRVTLRCAVSVQVLFFSAIRTSFGSRTL
jgi:hypothetical protein